MTTLWIQIGMFQNSKMKSMDSDASDIFYENVNTL